LCERLLKLCKKLKNPLIILKGGQPRQHGRVENKLPPVIALLTKAAHPGLRRVVCDVDMN